MIAEVYLPFEPNWDNSVSVKYTWKTKIQNSNKGKSESRSGLFTWPRRTVSFGSLAANPAEANYMKRLIYANASKVWGIPLWNELTPLTAQASSGQPMLLCDTTYRNFVGSQQVMIINGFNSYEVGYVGSTEDTYITLASDLTSTWPIGSMVCPVIQCRMGDFETPFSFDTSDVARFSMTFRETYEEDMTLTSPGAHAFSSYNSYNVFDTEPNWASPVKMSIGRPTDLLEYLGASLADTYYDESVMAFGHEHLFSTRQECYNFENFFHSKMGRFGAFFFPTWQRDFKITAAFASGADTISIDDIQYSSYWGTNDIIGKLVYLLFPDGTGVQRKVISAPSSTSLQFDSAIGKAATVDDLYGLFSCFLVPGRFAIDELEMKYRIPSVAESSINLTTVDDVNMLPS